MATFIHSLVFRDTNRLPFSKLLFAELTVLVEVTIQLRENCCQRARASPEAHAEPSIIPAVATGPTPNPKHTQFPAHHPNCQPSTGIGEPLANKLEHSYEIRCPTSAGTATVCQYLPSLSARRQRSQAQGELGPGPFSAGIFELICKWSSWFVFFVGILSQLEALSYKSGVALVIRAPFSACGVSRVENNV